MHYGSEAIVMVELFMLPYSMLLNHGMVWVGRTRYLLEQWHDPV